MSDLSPQMAAVFLLTVAAGGWYAASRAAADALSAGSEAPGRSAISHAISTAIIAILAILMNRPEVAVGIIFATSVASLTLVLGIVTVTASHTRPTLPRRVWSFVLPVALISLMIGFSSGIGWVQAGMLAFEGAVLLLLWNEAPLARTVDADPHPLDSAMTSAPPAPPSNSKLGLRVLQFMVALVASAVASWAAITAAQQLASTLNVSGLGLIAALMLSPALVLSMIGAGSTAASEGKYDHAVATLIGFVLLNLCAVLPLATAVWLTRPAWHPPVQKLFAGATVPNGTTAAVASSAPSTRPTSKPATTAQISAEPDAPAAAPTRLPYPLAVWRVDTVLMIAVGLLLLPVALGRWSLGRYEGAGLVAVYVIYMILTTIMAH